MEEEPKTYQAIMVSSTFTDLEAHRREIIDAINRFGFHPSVMEYSGARSDADVIETSLRMVRDAVAYVCVIGHKYGQTPVDPDRNPRGLSITELEFDEALRLGRPILLFLMAEDHPIMAKDVEPDKKRAKLDAFRKRAKRRGPASEVERVYDTFASREEFAKKAAIAIGLLAVQAAGTQTVPDRAVREAVARFIDVEPGASQAALTAEIERFETGYRALQAQVEAIVLVDNRVAALKADAEQALVEGDLDKARAAWRAAADAAREKAAEPVRNAALLKSAEADAHLLALDWQAADCAWTEAAGILAPFDREDAEAILEEAAHRLSAHGERFGRAGALNAAIVRCRALADALHARGDQQGAARLRNNLGNALSTQGERTGGPDGLRLLEDAVAAFREVLAVRTRADMPAQWAMTQNNLGTALQVQGKRTGGAEGLRRLDEAVATYREALTVYTRAGMPTQWAITQNNLGIALKIRGERTGGTEGLRLLDEAVAAYREALTVRTRADVPVKWAMTQNNLGAALQVQGMLADGAEGPRLLDEAVAAYREALAVHTRADMPASWAMTQNNLGTALKSQGECTSGDEGLRLLDEAVAAYREALTVYTRADMPADWAMTQNNLGNVLLVVGKRVGGAEGLGLLDDALAVYREAVTVFTHAEMPADWATTLQNIGLLAEAMADLEPAKARVHLTDAEAALADALSVYTPEHMPYHHEQATRSLERIRARLAALDR
jgi:tetratricopeptide (TPR) repeat protein